jgi:hypothetical protein
MENLNWAAVIPSRYLLAKDISSTQKLLIGLISSLSNLKGYCYASNDYFANCLNIKKITISQCISDLEEKGYITRKIIRGENNAIEQRTLVLNLNNEVPILENHNDLYWKTNIPILENHKDNKKNNIKENKNIYIPKIEEVESYFLEKGCTKEHAKQAFEYYESANWYDSRGKQVKNWKQKMLANWINNNNFKKPNNAKSTTDYYQEHYNRNLTWANEWDSLEGRQPIS